MKVRKYLYNLSIIFFLFFLSATLAAQNNFWMQRGGGVTPDEAYDISIDANGNTYTTGYFTSSATFGTTTLNSSGITDIFITKINNLGVYEWAVKAGGTGSDRALSIKADAAGNNYITGFFYGTATFGNQTITSSGAQDIFIAKYDNAGVLLWVKNAGGSNADIGNGINVDNAGNVIVTGEFAGTANFGGIPLTSLYNSTDVFTAKLDAAGNFLWVKKGSATLTDRGLDVACDVSGNIYVTGQYSDTITFDVPHLNTLNNVIFLVKYNSSGQEQWFREIGGGTMNNVSGIAIDPSSNVYLTGNFTGGVIFFGTPNVTLTNTYSNRIFIAKYDSNANLQWAYSDGSSNDFTSKNLTVDASGAYIIGDFKCVLNEYADQYGQGTFNSIGYRDIFVSKYDASGNWVWSRQCGGTDNDYAGGIAINTAGVAHIAGSFYKKMTFPYSAGYLGYTTNAFYNNSTTYCGNSSYGGFNTFNSAGSSDVFIAKNFDLTKGTYDYYSRSGTGCDKSYKGVCIDKHYQTDCPDTVSFCGISSSIIYANPNTNNIYNSTYFGGPEFNYLWSTGATTNYIYVTTTGYYSVKQTSADGCFVSSDTVYVIINPLPSKPTISDNVIVNTNSQTPTAINLCAPNSVQLTGGNFGVNSYKWTGGVLPSGGVAAQSVTVSTYGYYYFTVTDSNSCSESTYILVNIYPGLAPFIPKVTLVNDSDHNDSIKTCNCFELNLYDSIANPTGNQYNWFPSGLPYTTQTTWTSSSSIPYYDILNTRGTFCPTASGTYTINARIRRFTLCSADTFYVSKTLFVEKLSPFTITGNNSLCPGDSTLLTVSGGDGISYNWSGQMTATGSSIWVKQPGVYYVTGASGCYANVTVSMSPQPIVSMNPSSGISCPNDSVKLTCNGSGTFVWQGPSGIFGGNSSVVHVKTQGSYYCVRTDAFGCTLLSNTVDVNQYATPYLAVTPSAELCPGDTLVISAITSPGSIIQWQAPFSGSGLQQTVTSTGTYSCSITSCGIQTFASITVSESSVAAQISANGPLNFCGNDSVLLTANSGMDHYLWQPGSSSQQALNVFQTGTYTLITSDDYGCADTANITVNVLDAPTSMFSYSNTCLTDSVIFTNTSSPGTVNCSWDFGDGTLPDSTQHPVHTFANAGTYSVSLITANTNGCKDTITKSVTINPFPDAQFSTANVCNETSAQFIDLTTIPSPETIQSWKWTFGDNSAANTNQFITGGYLYTSPGNYNVQLVVVSNSGCTDSITQSITVYPKPIAAFGYTQTCLGSSTQFTDSSAISPGSITSWSWNFGDGSPLVAAQSPSHMYTMPGTFSISLIVTSNNGCTDTLLKNIIIHPNPQAQFNTANTCDGIAVQILDSSSITPIDAIQSWTWNFGDNTPLYTNQLISGGHLYSAAGSYSIKLLVVSNFGCSDSLTKIVTVHSNPVSAFNNTSVCNGNITQFTDSSIPVGGIISSWAWNFGDGSAVNTAQNPSYSYTNSGIHNVTLIVSNSSGCTDTSTNPVQVYYNPIAGFTHTDVCFGDSTHFTNTSSVNLPASITTFLWVFGDASPTSNLQVPVHKYTTPGIYNVTLVTTTADGCSGALTSQVNVFDPPTSSFTFNNTCLNNTSVFTNISITPIIGTIANWVWDFGDGSPLNTTLVSPAHMYTSAGNYQVALITHSSNLGCSDTLTNTISIFPIPTANFGFTDVCLNQAMNFNDSSASLNSTITGWSWNFGDATSINTNQHPTHTYNGFGTFSVSLIVTTNNGCKDTVVKSVTVHPLPAAQFTTTNVCQGDNTTFTDMSTIPATDTIQSWLWNFGNGNPLSTAQNNTIEYAGVGSYTVQLVVSSQFGCIDSIVKTSIVNPNPVVNFQEDDTVGCEPLCINFQNLSSITNGTVSWLWDFGNGSASSLENPGHCFINDSVYAPLNYNVVLTVTSDSGCAASLSKSNITVYPRSVPNFTAEPGTASIVNPIIAITDLTTGADFWAWNFGDLDTTSSPFPAPHTYADTGTYTITLVTSTLFDCIDTTYRNITIEPDFTFYIPNTFTPNDDGLNDTFTGQGIFITKFEMSIFDRWGNLIFFSDDASKPWDGKINHSNVMAQENIYVYSFKLTDFNKKKHLFKGFVSLVKP
ncbi:MAG: PKD domain-containing protein [Bacteroidota bacterium]